jgi:nucleoside-diphosphate-sugar epimerase
MNALVTGGGGFLGRHIVERLLDTGHTVTVLARGDYPALVARGARLVRADLADADAVARAVAGHDTVFHVAALAGVWGKREDFERTNVLGTRNVVAACKANGVARLVFTSSPSVVFDGTDHVDAGPDLPYPDRYEADYPRTKAEAERIALAANGPDLAVVALRPHLIWGPDDPHLLPRIFARAKAGRLRIVGDGTNRVSLTYVDNAAAAHVQAAAALAPGRGGAGRAFFINDPEPVALWPWLTTLLERVGLPKPGGAVPLGVGRAAGAVAEALWTVLPLSGEPPMTRLTASQLATSHTYRIEPAVEAFGYAPPVGAEEALERTVAWWKVRLAGG